MRKGSALLAAVVIAFLGGMTVLAAPETITVDGAEVIFDSVYYAENNPDVAAAVGTDRGTLLQHYLSFGRNEGRAAYAQTAEETAGQDAAQGSRRKLVKKECYFADGRMATYYEYSYDGQGNLIQELWYAGGTEPLCTRYVYDVLGNLIREEHYTKDGGISREVTYDGNGNKISDYDPQLYSRPITWEYICDNDGKIMEVVQTGANGSTYRIKNTYDDKGLLIEKTGTNSSGKTDLLIQYFYDEQGRPLLEESVTVLEALPFPGYDSDVTVKGHRDYAYNEQGRLIKEGNALYEYDSLGNMVRETRLDAGPTIQRIEYIYE